MPEIIKARYKWENGNLSLGKKLISNFYVEPVRKIKGSDKKKYIEVRYVFGEKEEFTEIIDYSEQNKLPIPPALYDKSIIFVRTAPEELLILLKLQLNDNIPENGYYINSLGWHYIGDRWIYCNGDKLLPESGLADIYIHPKIHENFHMRYDDTMSEDAILELVKEMIDFQNPAIHMCFLYLVMGLLRKLFFEANVAPKFVLYISGTTATYKTTLANYFFDIYNEGKGISRAAADLTSSESALRSIISEFKDCVFVLDDLSKSVSVSETRAKEVTVNNFIRTIANCEENNRKTGQRVIGELAQCGIAFTAEYVLSVESIVNRTILVDMDKFSLNEEILKFFQENELLMYSFSHMFLIWSVEHVMMILKVIKDEWNVHRENKTKDFNPRLVDSLGILWIVVKIIWKYFLDKGVWEKRYEKMFQKSLKNVLFNEQDKLDKLRFENKDYNIVEEIANLFAMKKLVPILSIFGLAGEASCWQEGGYIFTKTEHLANELQKVIKNETITVNKVSTALKKEGILKLDKSGDATVKKHGIRYYRIIPEVLADVTERDIKTLFPE